MNGIASEADGPEQDAQGGLLSEAWKAELSNGASEASTQPVDRLRSSASRTQPPAASWSERRVAWRAHDARA